MTVSAPLPEVTNVAWVKRLGGYVIVLQVTQGDRVISRTVLTPDAVPESRGAAYHRLVAEVGVRLLLPPKSKGSQRT